MSPVLTRPLWFPVMVLADQILGLDPADDWGGRWSFGQEKRFKKIFLPIFLKVKINYVCEAEMIALL